MDFFSSLLYHSLEHAMTKRMAGLLALLCILLISCSSYFVPNKKSVSRPAEFKMASERLWIDHIILVRSFVSYRLEGNTEAVKMIDKKVVRNMNEIGYLIAPFYGKGTYEQFSTLLSRHYTAVKEYLDTSLTSDRFARERAIDRLNANMEEIADFLSSENSDISMETISSLLRAHAGYNVAQIDAVKAKNFTAEQEVWEAMERNVYRIADALADGMIKQFPDKF